MPSRDDPEEDIDRDKYRAAQDAQFEAELDRQIGWRL